MEEKRQYKKPYKGGYKYKNNTGHKQWEKKEKKFDVEKWLKQNQNIEYPKRGKKNTLDKDNRNKNR